MLSIMRHMIFYKGLVQKIHTALLNISAEIITISCSHKQSLNIMRTKQEMFNSIFWTVRGYIIRINCIKVYRQGSLFNQKVTCHLNYG